MGPTSQVTIYCCDLYALPCAVGAPLLLLVVPGPPLRPPADVWSLLGWSSLPQVRQVCSKLHLLPKAHTPLSAPMGSPSRGGGVSRLSLPTPFSPIFVCPSAYRNLSPVLLFTHQLLPTYLQFSSSDCPFCLHRPFTYISLLYKPSFCHFSFSLWSTRDPAR